ncbi:MAG: glycosyltransferase [Lewinellaceae bacterium]|nr:glycosyltransferase [Lewinellaceae bacterium]
MRILHITPSYKPAYQYGGPIISVSRLAEEQARVGAEVWVYATTANGAGELDVPLAVPQEMDGVRVRFFRRWTGDHGHFSPALLWAVWRDARTFQVVHIHSWWNWVAFGAALVCRLRGIRAVVSPRGMLSPYTVRGRLRRIFQKNIGRWLLRNTLLHATSEQESLELQALNPGCMPAVVPNIVYLPEHIRIENQPAGEAPVQLLFLSRIDPKKGMDVLLRALAGLDAGAWLLRVGGAAGTDYQKKMEALAIHLGLADRVCWLGWVQGAAKWDLLAQSDLFVLPSHNENFAVAVLEALAVGTPVVVGKQVGLHRYVAKNDFGWSTNPTPEALCQTLKTAIADVEKRNRIRRTAPARVRADFEPAQVVRLYLEMYGL